MKQLELGIAGGREVGSAKEGHCYSWLCTSVCSFFFLEGDQMQIDREAYGSELCVSEIR